MISTTGWRSSSDPVLPLAGQSSAEGRITFLGWLLSITNHKQIKSSHLSSVWDPMILKLKKITWFIYFFFYPWGGFSGIKSNIEGKREKNTDRDIERETAATQCVDGRSMMGGICVSLNALFLTCSLPFSATLFTFDSLFLLSLCLGTPHICPP